MNRHFLHRPLVALVATALAAWPLHQASADERPNILIVTVDDMNCDSVGAFGCPLEGTTPSIDAFASKSLRYHHAHVQTGSCYPSRNVMFSGRYSHNTGVEGFYQVRDANYPHLVDLMKQGGYFVAIRGKVPHSTPYQPYGWDADLTTIDGQKLHTKDIKSYYLSTRRGIALADEANKPFCLNINISDPHKPFYGLTNRGEKLNDPNVPSRIYTPEEVPIPGFLFDHPAVRHELAHYYSSVRRADDCFAQVLKALDDSGEADSTVVMFLSDHGMPLPFAKTAVWNHSTRTPWIVRWPGVTKAGAVDDTHMISAVDLLPTVLEIAGIPAPKGFDGRSFAATLRGESQPDRDWVYKFHNENSGRNRSPMRSVQTKKYGYLYNPWSDGKRVFQTATRGTAAFRTMQKLAPTNEKIAARLRLFQHGVTEEFYDYENDPDALHNLIDDPRYAKVIDEHRQLMRKIMVESNDPVLVAFDRRDDSVFVSAFIDSLQAEADARRKASRKRNPKPQRQNRNLFQLKLPAEAALGRAFVVELKHKLPEALGKQKFHVTLKDAGGKRIHRIVESAMGDGSLRISFKIPADYTGKSIQVSAFVGEEYQRNLLHKTEGPVPIAP